MKRKYILIIVILAFVCSPFASFSQEDREKTEARMYESLASDNDQARKASLAYLQKYLPPSYLPLLTGAIIKDDNTERRNRYMEALKAYPSENSVGSWVEILEKSGSFILKQEVIEYLSTLNERNAVLPIARELYSPFKTVRKSAALALQKSGDDRVYPFIIEMAGSENPVRRIYAVEALYYLYDMRFYQILMGLLEDENKSVRIFALHCVLENGIKKANFTVRKRALDDPDEEVRINAIMVLGEFQDTGALYVVLRTLKDKDRGVRLESARSLYKFSHSGSAYTIATHLLEESDDEIKDLIIDTLLRVRKTGNVYGLRKVLLQDVNFRMRIKAAWALGILREERNLNILLEGLKDEDYHVRAEVCSSLGKYRSRYAINRLVEMVKNDKVRYVRSAALYALKYMNFRESIVPLFDIYSSEEEPVFREMLRAVLRQMMSGYL